MSYSYRKSIKSGNGLVLVSTFNYPDNVPVCEILLDSDKNQMCIRSVFEYSSEAGIDVGYFVGDSNINGWICTPRASNFSATYDQVEYFSEKGAFDSELSLVEDNDIVFYDNVYIVLPNAQKDVKFCMNMSHGYFNGDNVILMKCDRMVDNG